MHDNPKITVIVVAYRTRMRDGIAALCREDGLEVLGAYSDANTAFEMISSLKPDVTIVEAPLPHISGIQLAQQIRASHSSSKIILLFSRDQTDIRDLLQAGAHGYLPRH